MPNSDANQPHATVSERARYLDAKEYSKGILYVFVNGQLVVDNGKIVPGTFPGRPVYATRLRPEGVSATSFSP
jgi:hypothetical protein